MNFLYKGPRKSHPFLKNLINTKFKILSIKLIFTKIPIYEIKSYPIHTKPSNLNYIYFYPNNGDKLLVIP